MKLLPSLALALALGTGAAMAQTTPKLTNEPVFDARKPGEAIELFNGKDLENWVGNPKLWSVQDGAITGITTAEDPIKHNTFLVYTGELPGDFDLTFKYKLTGGNSGVQYRSRVNQPGESGPIISGYQGDFEAGKTYSGILYEERGRGILAKRGEKTKITDDDSAPNKVKVEVTGSVGNSDEIQAGIKADDWNEYRIVAKGNHLQHFINGKQTIDVTDEGAKAAEEGVIAIQVHKGPPMKVQIKDLVLKEAK